ncbi:MAG: sulfite exporter TauE/SafE family protein [SAR324 cluster bacterium]|nr:sulfite exporter TauE/SafE family protein [SAR324 cluster bacterium]
MESIFAIDLTFLVLLGLTGSLHCAGMCGAICSTYSLSIEQSNTRSLWKFHSAYMAGRLLAYGWIGALLGTLGMAFYTAMTPDSNWRDLGGLLAGVILIAGGLSSLFQQKWPENIALWISKSMSWLIPSLQRWQLSNSPWRVMPLGMISGILPCGLMWAAEMQAFASNSLVRGMLIMLTFCLITSPAILLTGTIISKISPHFRFRSVQFAGIIVILMGIRLFWNHFIANDLWRLCLPPF